MRSSDGHVLTATNMSSSLLQYQYQPLQPQQKLQVRLVTIEPGLSQSPVRCSIDFALLVDERDYDNVLTAANGNRAQFGGLHAQHANSNIPSYEAVSYSWGDGKAERQIELNGCSFDVTDNLYTALVHLRHIDRSRMLWIDAICLNQDDITEKQHQVPIMYLIYAQATRVIVWLGSESQDSVLAMERISYLHSTVQPGREHEISDTNHFTEWPINLFSRTPLNHEEVDAAFAIYRLLSRPWFRRAWIVQEVSFAREALVYCGASSILWTQLTVAIHIVRTNHELLMALTDIAARGLQEDGHDRTSWPSDAMNNALSLLYDRDRVRRERPEQTQSLATELSWCMGINKGRLCQKPHDRTFSVLGIAGKDFRDQFQTDYNKSIDDHNREVVRHFYQVTGSIDLMLHAQHNAWRLSGSSWAPEWAMPERAAVFHQNQQASHGLLPVTQIDDIVFAPNSHLLHIKSVIVGTIIDIRLEFDQLLKPDQPFFDPSQDFDLTTGLPPEQRAWWEF